MGRAAPLLTALLAAQVLDAAMVAAIAGRDLVVTAPAYRLRVAREACALAIELRDPAGRWRRACRDGGQPEFALMVSGRAHTLARAPARVRHVVAPGRVTIGIATVLTAERPAVARIHLVCVEAGILVHFRLDAGPWRSWPVGRRTARVPSGCGSRRQSGRM